MKRSFLSTNKTDNLQSNFKALYCPNQYIINKLDKKKKKKKKRKKGKELTQDIVPWGGKDSDKEIKGRKKEGGDVNLVLAH
jgi:hypothetical protein